MREQEIENRDLEEGRDTKNSLRFLEMLDSSNSLLDVGNHHGSVLSTAIHVTDSSGPPSDKGVHHLHLPASNLEPSCAPGRERSREVLNQHNHHYHLEEILARQAEWFGSMGALDILRESIRLLRANSGTLMSLMFLLICPVSGLFLSRALLHGRLANKLAAHLYVAASSVGLLHYLSLVKTIYESLSQALLSYVFSAPVLFTVWLLAKASIIYIVSGIYSSKSVSLYDSLKAGVRLWRRIFCTYFWNCVILVAFGTTMAICFLFIVSLLDALQCSADLIFLMEVALGLFDSVIFAQILVVGSLANVVSILEEQYGLAALSRSFELIKGKIQVALSLFCFNLLGMVMVESLYQYRVIGIPPSNYAISTESRLWEGPLLVVMYSFLLLLDAIMGCVFYFTCKSSTFRFAEDEVDLTNKGSFTDV